MLFPKVSKGLKLLLKRKVLNLSVLKSDNFKNFKNENVFYLILTFGRNMKGKKDNKKIYKGGLKPGPVEKKYETPNTTYKITPDNLVKILQKMGTANYKDYNTLEEFFTKMKIYEDHSVLTKPKKEDNNDDSLIEVHQTKPDFKEKIVNALFWVPKFNSYKYLRVRIAPSNIKKAGMGAYAVDKIPKGSIGFYRGVAKTEDYVNMFYSWVIKSYDKKGNPDNEDEVLYYVDASEPKLSNWTRYVNCGLTERENNFDSDQKYDKIDYVAIKDISVDDELLISYGIDYMQNNLGMEGY